MPDPAKLNCNIEVSVKSVPETKSDQPQDGVKEEKPECTGCNAVAFTTPLLISAYLISQHYSVEKIKTYPIASDWTGRHAWRLQLHRVHMCVLAPITICYFTYSYMFKFGVFTPNSDEESKTVLQEAKNDVDSFTRGTLRLADWASKATDNSRDSLRDKFSRFMNMFGGAKPSQSNDEHVPDKGKPK